MCSLCGKAVLKHIGSLENSKSGKYFCNRQCKELAQSIDGGLILHPPHYIDGRRSYRYRAFKTYGKVCRVCGYSGYEKMLDVDHIDSNRKNNRIENLRPATRSQNCSNTGIGKKNTSGCKGVYWKKDSKKWSVQIQANGKRINIGIFDNLELADLVAQEARDKFHGKYARN